MKCKKPYQLGVISCGCGQCMPCRINRRRIWTTRLMLESLVSDKQTFITLTYNNENEPKDKSLDPGHVRNFIKRLRKKVWPQKIRYFFVGEYGDESQRPHYHGVMYGVNGCLHGRTKIGRDGIRCCTNCKVMEDIWKKGNIYNGTVSFNSVQYVVGYVLKRMTNSKNMEVKKKLNGRYPEFSRMSLKPGIGADALETVAETLRSLETKDWRSSDEDVPMEIKVKGKLWPFGRYLRGRLREKVGKEKETPEKSFKELGWKMRFLLEENIQRNGWTKKGDLSSIFAEMNKQPIASIEKREEIYKSRRTL